jgi:hypothetical protein
LQPSGPNLALIRQKLANLLLCAFGQLANHGVVKIDIEML